jgi:Flp pilus assembly protein TadD
MSCVRIVPLLLGAAAAFSSCATVDRAVRGPVEALVVVPGAESGRSEQHLVEASASRSCQAGVRALRNGDYGLAITGFHQALLADPDDEDAHFGLGLAYELTGRVDEALHHYEAASRVTSEPDPNTTMAIERARAKLRK